MESRGVGVRVKPRAAREYLRERVCVRKVCVLRFVVFSVEYTYNEFEGHVDSL